MKRTRRYSFANPYVFNKVHVAENAQKKILSALLRRQKIHTVLKHNFNLSEQWIVDGMNSCWTYCYLCTEMFQFAQGLVHAVPQPLLEMLSFAKHKVSSLLFQTIHIITNLYNKNPPSQTWLHFHRHMATGSPVRLANNLLLCPFLLHPK